MKGEGHDALSNNSAVCSSSCHGFTLLIKGGDQVRRCGGIVLPSVRNITSKHLANSASNSARLFGFLGGTSWRKWCSLFYPTKTGCGWNWQKSSIFQATEVFARRREIGYCSGHVCLGTHFPELQDDDHLIYGRRKLQIWKTTSVLVLEFDRCSLYQRDYRSPVQAVLHMITSKNPVWNLAARNLEVDPFEGSIISWGVPVDNHLAT